MCLGLATGYHYNDTVEKETKKEDMVKEYRLVGGYHAYDKIDGKINDELISKAVTKEVKLFLSGEGKDAENIEVVVKIDDSLYDNKFTVGVKGVMFVAEHKGSHREWVFDSEGNKVAQKTVYDD